jgi:hypothetical protein
LNTLSAQTRPDIAQSCLFQRNFHIWAFRMMKLLQEDSCHIFFSRKSSSEWFWKTLSDFHFCDLGVFGNLMLWRSQLLGVARHWALPVTGPGRPGPGPPAARHHFLGHGLAWCRRRQAMAMPRTGNAITLDVRKRRGGVGSGMPRSSPLGCLQAAAEE